jgi:3-phosphoshikimate 1-carboxyvinyltransferase
MTNTDKWVRVAKADPDIQGELWLKGSKSISNRALIALALARVEPADWLDNLSDSRDTLTLQALLSQASDWYDAGDAGATFRFMAAYLCLKPGRQTLTGSPRMLERPVGPLVSALRALGADIQYLGQEGYPPLLIGSFDPVSEGGVPVISIQADVSSQFLSALMLIGPYLPKGLTLIPQGALVSRPYVDMTMQLMRFCGAEVGWEQDRIHIAPGAYIPRKLSVEADWSSASYWYAMVSFSKQANVTLHGLAQESWQGDAVLVKMMENFGVKTSFEDHGLRLEKTDSPIASVFEQDFLEYPDLAQTLAVTCAGHGSLGLFSGLQTLMIKETDRIAALKQELGKVGVSWAKLPAHFSKKSPEKIFYQLMGKANLSEPPAIQTYGDHRMVMSFAALAVLSEVRIENPAITEKSYPAFWEDMKALGFTLEAI